MSSLSTHAKLVDDTAPGDYCDVADLVLEMRNYQCYDITASAREVARDIPSAVPDHEGQL